MPFPTPRTAKPPRAVGPDIANYLAHLIRMAWRAHCDLLSHSLVYRAVMVLVADTILDRLDLGRLLQVLYDLASDRFAGQSPQF